jgi:hypothetical protein
MQNIAILEIQTQLQSPGLKEGREIFLCYFTDLYRDISPQTLGLSSETKSYLNTIFDRTEERFNKNELQACLALQEDAILGFSTYSFLADANAVLVHTLPINLSYINNEQDIRNAFVEYARKQFPRAESVVIMVRKANSVHEALCFDGGFKQDNTIFAKSEYLKKTYDAQHYNAYVQDIKR